jgi:hypothetical protein
MAMYRRQTLLDDYADLREAGATSDFPNLLGNVMYRRLIDWAQTVPDVWRKYSAITEAPDLRPQTSIIGYESEDLLPIGEQGAYHDSKLADAKFQWQLATYGRAFSIGREVILNDDLGYIRQQPRRFGRAASRSLALFATRSVLEGNGTCFDGVALFDTATHANYEEGAGTVLTAANLQKAIQNMGAQTVLSTFQSVRPKMLVVPTALEFTAKQIINSALIVAVGTAGTVTQLGNANVLQNALDIVVDPFLTSQTAYYLFAEPADVPVVMIGFLDGKQTPDLLIEKPTMVKVAGGDDPYEFEYDVMRYKVRFDYGGTVALWWGAYKFKGAV